MNLTRAGACIVIFALFIHAPAAVSEETPVKLNILGLQELENGNAVAAGEFFLKAVNSDPYNKYYCNNMAASLMRRGDYTGAEIYLKRAVDVDKHYAKALANMAVTLFHLGRYRESYSFYMKSLRADSRYTEDRFEKSKTDSAVKKLLQKKPDDKVLRKISEYIERKK